MHQEAIKAFGAFIYAFMSPVWPFAILVFCINGGIKSWFGIMATALLTSISYVAASTNVREATLKVGVLETTFWFLTMLSLAMFVYALMNPALALFVLAIALVVLTLSYLRITSKFIYHRVKCGPVLSWF
ncbi:hypothetical protein [Halioxenophilus aromaticivorans]|uniref:hypothetical protein n=1 Tax=Halioxenophilus aromaticivorans TaxID=1306992 RepID=UPI0031EA16DD